MYLKCILLQINFRFQNACKIYRNVLKANNSCSRQDNINTEYFHLMKETGKSKILNSLSKGRVAKHHDMIKTLI